MTPSILCSRAVAAAAALALVAAPAAHAAHPGVHGSYVVEADVVQVSPRYGWRTVSEPVRQCVDVGGYPGRRDAGVAWGYRTARERGGYRRDPGFHYRRYDGGRRDYAGSGGRHDGAEVAAGLVGGLIGGLIGHQFGGGRGKTALTVAGAALGASIATDRVRRARAYPEPAYTAPVRRCTETRQTRQVRGLDGYDVTYRYQGRTFHKWMDEHPGDTVRIHVSVEPDDDLAER